MTVPLCFQSDKKAGSDVVTNNRLMTVGGVGVVGEVSDVPIDRQTNSIRHGRNAESVLRRGERRTSPDSRRRPRLLCG